MADFRSERMNSPEGKGKARRAWDEYARRVNLIAAPVASPVIRNISVIGSMDLMGFWLVWQLHGGYEGLRNMGMSRTAIYRRIALFRKATGVHPDECQIPGIELDLDLYWAESASAFTKPPSNRSTR